jgi:hypothetical protein
MTDAGGFDVLAGLEAADGHLVPYDELVTRSTVIRGDGLWFALRHWRTSSSPRSGQTDQRTMIPSLSCVPCEIASRRMKPSGRSERHRERRRSRRRRSRNGYRFVAAPPAVRARCAR